MVQAHTIANHAGLANDDARAVVDGDGATQRRAGVNVDAGDTMSRLADEARQERHLSCAQGVGEAVASECVEPRVGEDDFVKTRGGRVGVEG